MQRTEASPIIDRLISWSFNHPMRPAMRYLVATVLVLVAALIRALLITSLLPWLLFIPVTLLITLTMGRRTGIYAVFLSAIAAAVTLDHHGAAFWLTTKQWLASGLYVIVSCMIIAIGAELRAALLRSRRLSEERERAYASLVEKEEQWQLLNHELGHRLKNMLAIVQAVTSQTLRQASDLKAADTALSSRLAAFGRATDVLTASTWEPAELNSLAKNAVSNLNIFAGRIRIDGPSIRFPSQVALALALAFHELATNAIKYGALSNDSGHIDLRWSIQPGANADQPRFLMEWKEVGGPTVQPPSRRGFGSVLIERSLRSHFQGMVELEYHPGGLVFRIDAPLEGAVAKGSA